MKKILATSLILSSCCAFASMPFVNTSKIPPPYYGTSVISAAVNNGVIVDHDYGGKTRLKFKVFKYSSEDPIVSPGVTAAHLHMFFGNSCIDKFSTVANLLACDSSTMIGGPANKSAYWMPPIIDTRTGAVVQPYQILLYYTSKSINALKVQPFPEGLKVLAGNPKATTLPKSGPYTFYCSSTDRARKGNYRLDANGLLSTTVSQYQIPNCFGGKTENVNLNFIYPNCWNGVQLDSADHKSHMSYPLKNGTCPRTHPVVLPIAGASFDWHIPKDFDSKYWRLSSDMYDNSLPGGYTMHMDLFSAWQPLFINMIVDNVLKPTKESGMGWIGINPNTGMDTRFVN